MMHQKVSASTQFATLGVCVLTTDGRTPDEDKLAYYDPSNSAAWISMTDPVDVRLFR
jgi:hypothetical protein